MVTKLAEAGQRRFIRHALLRAAFLPATGLPATAPAY